MTHCLYLYAFHLFLYTLSYVNTIYFVGGSILSGPYCLRRGILPATPPRHDLCDSRYIITEPRSHAANFTANVELFGPAAQYQHQYNYSSLSPFTCGHSYQCPVVLVSYFQPHDCFIRDPGEAMVTRVYGLQDYFPSSSPSRSPLPLPCLAAMASFRNSCSPPPIPADRPRPVLRRSMYFHHLHTQDRQYHLHYSCRGLGVPLHHGHSSSSALPPMSI